jgi:hypothetical protein
VVSGVLVPFLWSKLVRAMERFTGFGEDLGAWTSETRANRTSPASSGGRARPGGNRGLIRSPRGRSRSRIPGSGG